MIHKLSLTMISGVGSTIARQLLDAFGSPEAIFSEKKQALEKIPGIGAKIAGEIKNPEVMKRAEKELDFMTKHNINGFFFTDDGYPSRLRQCPDAPLLLFFKGNTDFNKHRIISIVGTRNATVYGRELTEQFIADIAKSFPDTQIISGLAYGIDICAHRAALNNNLSTIGVLAHGLDRIYPQQHKGIAIEMLERGGLLTDFPSGTNPDRQNFVMRNRIVAGLSDATIVVESADRGGSLITADIAFSYSRDVFAFPGRVGDRCSAGCNKIIRLNKAGLITSAADFINSMGWEENKNITVQTEISFAGTEDDSEIVAIIRREKEIQIDQLAIALDVSASELSVMLFELEMNGVVKALPGSRYKLI